MRLSPRPIFLAALALGAACTSLDGLSGGTGSPTPTTDGGADATAVPGEDAGANDGAIKTCATDTLFGTPVAVAGIASADDETGIALTPDQLQAYYSRTGDGGTEQMYLATRATDADPFGPPSGPLFGMQSSAHLGEPALAPDGLVLFFNRKINAADFMSVVVASRASTSADFGNVATVTGLAANADTVDPYPTGAALYFSSDRGAPTRYDLLRAPRSGTGVGAAELLDELDSVDDDVAPVVSNDELVIYFASNRAGTNKLDIFVSTRASTTERFSAPKPVPELQSAEHEVPRWLSPDRCTLYLMSYRVGGPGQGDIYVARRSPR